MSRWIILGLWLSVAIGVIPSAASAGPEPLTPAQMDRVTAGSGLSDLQLNLQLNLNVNVQVAAPVAVAVAVCGICSQPPSAFASAIGANFNFANLQNSIGR
jgi:hypothetical protein